MKLDRKQDLNVLYQVCVFGADRKNKMAALASDWLRHFRLLLWNRWTEFSETWQEARSQRPLPSLCFSGWSEKQDGCPGLLLAETFSTSPLKPLNGIQQNLTGSKILTSSPSLCFSGRSEKQDGHPGLWLAETFSTSTLKSLNRIQWNLTGSKISTSSTKFVFFGLIGKTRWPPWPLICWDIFDFSSETAEWISTKLDRKQDLNVLYQACVLGPSVNKNVCLGRFLKKMAYCTQVHDMWPFVPLVYEIKGLGLSSFCLSVCSVCLWQKRKEEKKNAQVHCIALTIF